MRELTFVVDFVLSLLVGAFLLRLLFQLLRADFRNPFAQAIVRITNPVIVPLRKVLPAMGRVDTASVVAVLLVQALRMALVGWLAGGGLPGVVPLLLLAFVELVDITLLVFLVAIIVSAVLSWVAPDGYSPIGRLVASLVDPVLAPFRRFVPPLGGLDLAPLVAILAIYVLRMVLNGRIVPALAGLG
jgi:YggT family protein